MSTIPRAHSPLDLRRPLAQPLRMTPQLRRKLAAAYTALAGGMDAVTGPWLVFAPASALAAMGVEAEDDTLFVSWVGAFVGAVGWSYLWALWRWWKLGDTAFLRSVWRVTILFRLAAGSYCAAQIALDLLDPAWFTVPLADFLLAGVQIWLLRAGWPEPGNAETA
ncbi:MAG TPA: hypothetical protein VK178_01700 [Opitutaceae bacterium]|nr:hypothetical protein [Opitutaceae bacterium]